MNIFITDRTKAVLLTQWPFGRCSESEIRDRGLDHDILSLFFLSLFFFFFLLIVILVISHFSFEGGTLVLIAPFPCNYLSFILI